MALEAFARWLVEEELRGREDSPEMVDALVEAVGRIAAGAGDLTGARVLDLGSGTGAVALAAVDRGATAIALDVDREALKRGRRLASAIGASVDHVRGDARALPFGNDSFTASVHRSVLASMDRPGRAVTEERRVLVPRGRVSCSESLAAEARLEARDPGLVEVWETLAGAVAGARTTAHTGEEIVALYREAGFHEIRLSHEEHGVTLDTPEAIARAFVVRPPAGLSSREAWEAAGVPAGFLDEFLARMALAAERGRPATLHAPEGFLTATAPG